MNSMVKQRKPRDPSWMPANYTADQVIALQALQKGEADAGQQGMVLDWLLNDACGIRELSFRSDADGGARETAFAEGRRFVGLQTAKLLSMSGAMIAEIRKKDVR